MKLTKKEKKEYKRYVNNINNRSCIKNKLFPVSEREWKEARVLADKIINIK